MKKFLLVLVILVVIVGLIVLMAVLLTPWMDRWHTTPEERAMELPGDQYNTNPGRVANRAVTINAGAEKIYPWILQIGADKSGMYSYTWLENLVGCKMAKDETIHPEWQNLAAGDEMKMCAGDFAPPPYIVVETIPNQAVIYGHKEKDAWVDVWQFVLVPQADGTTRLITRTSTNMVGGMWEVIRPISFTMERKMLLTIKHLAEQP
ncbi:hypothetical protein EG832_08345 [bacterium]|nr:hypothetical protein [bacterium]